MRAWGHSLNFIQILLDSGSDDVLKSKALKKRSMLRKKRWFFLSSDFSGEALMGSSVAILYLTIKILTEPRQGRVLFTPR